MAKFIDNIRIFDSIIDLPAMDSAAEAETIKTTVLGWIKDANAQNITEALQVIETYGAAIIMSAFTPNHYSITPKSGSLFGAVKKHGGSRPGAGRPLGPVERKTTSFKISEFEKEKIRELLKELRK